MPKKRKAKKRNSDYKPVFTDAEHKLMQEYGIGSLMDEVGINRVMLIRTLNKMNEVRKQLTFRDHLDALRAVSYTTGRIAQLLDTRERLYQPYNEIEERYQQGIKDIREEFDKFGVAFCGQEQWDLMQLKAALEAEQQDRRRSKSTRSRNG